MSDMGDRDRGRIGGGRRRRPRGAPPGRGERKQWPKPKTIKSKQLKFQERDYEFDTPLPPSRPTIILAKHTDPEPQPAPPPVTSGRASASTSPSPQSRQVEKPMMVLKPREEITRTIVQTPTSLHSIPVGTLQGDTPPQQTYLHRSTLEGKLRMNGPAEMNKCMKLIDEHQQWYEEASDLLLDQTDFLVVGVVGLQGCGKSTIMSLLAGNTESDPPRSYVFPPQSRELKEECCHMTNGVDIYVTSQRIILLDVQPLLSASVLEQHIHADKKIPPEFTMSENFTEVQCLQQVTFLMTVCNVLLVVQDWFTDMSLLRFLQTAEMLKPATPSSSHDSNTTPEEQHDYYPHVVFVQNRAKRDDFSLSNFTAMQETLATIFATSKLKMKGGISMTTGRQVFGLNPAFVKSDINLFLLPHMNRQQGSTGDNLLTMLPEYKGHPSFKCLIDSLRAQVYTMPREPHTHSTLTEKNWFHYAARIWDSIRKSQMIAEYNRLLP